MLHVVPSLAEVSLHGELIRPASAHPRGSVTPDKQVETAQIKSKCSDHHTLRFPQYHAKPPSVIGEVN